MNKKWIAALAALLLLASACTVQKTRNPASSPSVSQGGPSSAEQVQAAPEEQGDFSGVSISGEAVGEEIFSNHLVTMVNVWATYCGYCIREMPYLAELSREYADKGVGIVGIVGDVGDGSGGISESDLAAVQKILQDAGAEYPQLLPVGDANASFMSSVYGYPTTFFVDSRGKSLTQPVVGGRSKEEWAGMLDELLSATADSASPALSADAASEEGASSAQKDIPLSDSLFASFFGSDLDGNTIDASWFGDADMVLLLVWNAADAELTQQAFDTVRAYEAAHPDDYAALRFAGLALDAGSMGPESLDALKKDSPLTLLASTPELDSYFTSSVPAYYAVAPWGQVSQGPQAEGAAVEDIQGFLSESFFAFYLSDCCSE